MALIFGCTACGKSELAKLAADRWGADILSVDSMSVYRRMDIGTAKPVQPERRQYRYHLVDVVEPWESFSVGRYVELAEEAIADIASRGKPVLAVGGTALYIKALTEGLFEGPGADEAFRREIRRRAAAEGTAALHEELSKIDPAAADRISPNDLRRIERALEVYFLSGKPISELQTQWDAEKPQRQCTMIGLRREKADQNHRINMRVHRMMEHGFVDEVRSLLADWHGMSKQARQALGYAEIIEHLEGKIGLAETVEKIKINTRRFAKSQRTWFRRFGDAHWIDLDADAGEGVADKVLELIEPKG